MTGLPLSAGGQALSELHESTVVVSPATAGPAAIANSTGIT
jgi:hypothetical protein